MVKVYFCYRDKTAASPLGDFVKAMVSMRQRMNDQYRVGIEQDEYNITRAYVECEDDAAAVIFKLTYM